MIQTFKNKLTNNIWQGKRIKLDANIQHQALKKLRYLHVAIRLDDLRLPPSNRLEALHGNRQGQYSIRVNKQYRICFTWDEAGASDVEFTDYH
ncbi:MAG: type II toxin-antitoxin system RelE/ParE family toxin [Victivallaceae bacterium]|nr:type II toxin-antitoxin system RelE/ParE family toxin [Victivallaceae bacterium]